MRGGLTKTGSCFFPQTTPASSKSLPNLFLEPSPTQPLAFPRRLLSTVYLCCDRNDPLRRGGGHFRRRLKFRSKAPCGAGATPQIHPPPPRCRRCYGVPPRRAHFKFHPPLPPAPLILPQLMAPSPSLAPRPAAERVKSTPPSVPTSLLPFATTKSRPFAADRPTASPQRVHPPLWPPVHLRSRWRALCMGEGRIRRDSRRCCAARGAAPPLRAGRCPKIQSGKAVRSILTSPAAVEHRLACSACRRTPITGIRFPPPPFFFPFLCRALFEAALTFPSSLSFFYIKGCSASTARRPSASSASHPTPPPTFSRGSIGGALRGESASRTPHRIVCSSSPVLTH